MYYIFFWKWFMFGGTQKPWEIFRIWFYQIYNLNIYLGHFWGGTTWNGGGRIGDMGISHNNLNVYGINVIKCRNNREITYLLWFLLANYFHKLICLGHDYQISQIYLGNTSPSGKYLKLRTYFSLLAKFSGSYYKHIFLGVDIEIAHESSPLAIYSNIHICIYNHIYMDI